MPDRYSLLQSSELTAYQHQIRDQWVASAPFDLDGDQVNLDGPQPSCKRAGDYGGYPTARRSHVIALPSHSI